MGNPTRFFASLPRRVAAMLVAAAAAGCAGNAAGDPATADRLASDVPDRFVPGAGAEEMPPGACRVTLVDARDGTRITLARSRSGLGDYIVPEDRYGVRRGELLRIECDTGRALGIVRQ